MEYEETKGGGSSNLSLNRGGKVKKKFSLTLIVLLVLSRDRTGGDA